jgi:hypothetical protein
MSRKTRQWKVEDGSKEVTVSKMGKLWSCSCKEPDCKHIKKCKLELLLDKRVKSAKKEKPVYHFHDLMRVRQEVKLMLKVQGMSEMHPTYRITNDPLLTAKNYVNEDLDTRRRARGRNKNRTNALRFSQSYDHFRDFLPGLTKKRLKEIYLEFFEKRKRRLQVNAEREVLAKRQAEKFPVNLRIGEHKTIPLNGPEERMLIKSKHRDRIQGGIPKRTVGAHHKGLLGVAALKKIERLFADNLVDIKELRTSQGGGSRSAEPSYADLNWSVYCPIEAYYKNGKILFKVWAGEYYLGNKEE